MTEQSVEIKNGEEEVNDEMGVYLDEKGSQPS